MRLQLNVSLLRFLSQHGYRYCFSKTTVNAQEDILINLTPIRKRPNVRCFPKDYDTFYALNREVKMMSKGIDEHTFVFVTLDAAVTAAYLKPILLPMLGHNHLHPVN